MNEIPRRFFRVIEREDGTWACRQGAADIDHHPGKDEALEHIAVIASDQRPAHIFLHRLDGAVASIATLD